MGILAIGVSFGAPIALAGVMLHVLAHAAAKGNAFMGAGVFAIKFGSKQISAHRGAMDLLPWSGPLFLLAVLALSAMPPFGIFRSEFQIVAGGLGAHNYAAAAVLIVLVTLAFLACPRRRPASCSGPAGPRSGKRYHRTCPPPWPRTRWWRVTDMRPSAHPSPAARLSWPHSPTLSRLRRPAGVSQHVDGGAGPGGIVALLILGCTRPRN